MTETPDPRRYISPAEGLKALEESFGYWTSKITDLSFQYCLALIAANWAVHTKSLLTNGWGMTSVALAIFSLCLSACGALVISEMCRNEFTNAVRDREKWRKRWEASERIDSEWPFTTSIDCWARFFSWARIVFPFLAGIFFIIGAGP